MQSGDMARSVFVHGRGALMNLEDGETADIHGGFVATSGDVPDGGSDDGGMTADGSADGGMTDGVSAGDDVSSGDDISGGDDISVGDDISAVPASTTGRYVDCRGLIRFTNSFDNDSHVTMNTCPQSYKKVDKARSPLINNVDMAVADSPAIRAVTTGFVLGLDGADDVFEPVKRRTQDAGVWSIPDIARKPEPNRGIRVFDANGVVELLKEHKGLRNEVSQAMLAVDNTPDPTTYNVRHDRIGKLPTTETAQGFFLPESCVFIGDLQMKANMNILQSDLYEKLAKCGLCFITMGSKDGMPYAIAQFTNEVNAKKAIDMGSSDKLDIVGRDARAEMSSAPQVLLMKRRDGGLTTEDEINSKAIEYGAVKNLWQPTDTEIATFGLPKNVFFVEWAYHLDFKDAQKGLRHGGKFIAHRSSKSAAVTAVNSSKGGAERGVTFGGLVLRGGKPHGTGNGGRFGTGSLASIFGPGSPHGMSGACYPQGPATYPERSLLANPFPGMDGSTVYLSNAPPMPEAWLIHFFSVFGIVVDAIKTGRKAFVIFHYASDCQEAVRSLGPGTVLHGHPTKVQMKDLNTNRNQPHSQDVPYIMRKSYEQPSIWMATYNRGNLWVDLPVAWHLAQARINTRGYARAATYGKYSDNLVNGQPMGPSTYQLHNFVSRQWDLNYQGAEAEAAAQADCWIYTYAKDGRVVAPPHYTAAMRTAFFAAQSLVVAQYAPWP